MIHKLLTQYDALLTLVVHGLFLIMFFCTFAMYSKLRKKIRTVNVDHLCSFAQLRLDYQMRRRGSKTMAEKFIGDLKNLESRVATKMAEFEDGLDYLQNKIVTQAENSNVLRNDIIKLSRAGRTEPDPLVEVLHMIRRHTEQCGVDKTTPEWKNQYRLLEKAFEALCAKYNFSPEPYRVGSRNETSKIALFAGPQPEIHEIVHRSLHNNLPDVLRMHKEAESFDVGMGVIPIFQKKIYDIRDLAAEACQKPNEVFWVSDIDIPNLKMGHIKNIATLFSMPGYAKHLKKYSPLEMIFYLNNGSEIRCVVRPPVFVEPKNELTEKLEKFRDLTRELINESVTETYRIYGEMLKEGKIQAAQKPDPRSAPKPENHIDPQSKWNPATNTVVQNIKARPCMDCGTIGNGLLFKYFGNQWHRKVNLLCGFCGENRQTLTIIAPKGRTRDRK